MPVRAKGLVVVAIPLLPLLVMAALVYDSQREAVQASESVRRTLQDKALLDRLQVLLVEAELGARGYLISRNPDTLRAYRDASEAMRPVLTTLAERFADEPEQMARLRTLGTKGRPLTSIIEYADSAPAGAPMPLELLARSRASMAGLRARLAEMQQAEDALLEGRSRDAEAARNRIRWATGGGVLVGLIGGIGAAVLFASSIAGRVALVSRNAERLAEGQPLLPMPESRDEVGDLSVSLVRASALLQQRHEELDRRLAELAAANKELDAFSYSVSHDLRAPLRHVAGFASLLEKSASNRLDDDGRRYVKTISAAAATMGRLIDDLLSFSRMGRTELLQNEVDLDELVGEIVADTRRADPGRAIEWSVGPLPLVTADRALLRQVFANLIANAVKYTSKRPDPRIAIGADPGNGEWILYVKDNGVGFDMQYVDKLFGVFQRLHSHEEFEGTGIGLANVRRIVHRHGGRTWAEGHLGAGATFFVALPRRAEGEMTA